MCGICGIVAYGSQVSRSALERMSDAIRRRGPDGVGMHVDGSVGIAMRRLAIIDLDGGHQPIFSEDGSIAIVFNGEIYNYRELRDQLQERGHVFRTDSDTEVIVHLYEEYGTRAPEHLSGMFAYAIWDAARKTVVLARDRLGIKPLYYSETERGIVFGSEIKALLASGMVSTDLDHQAIDEYLTYCSIPSPRTIYSSIKQLEPGTTFTIPLRGHTETQRYWSVPAATEDHMSEVDWISECESRLRAAVARHLVSDVPVGAFLSGGVDSGLLVAMMADAVNEPVETFTVGFHGAGAAFIDERRYAREMAARYRLRHHEIEVTPDFQEILPDILQAFDQPFADDSIIPSYYVSKVAASRVKVAVTGLGGDELFAGYRRHLGMVIGARYRRVPAAIRRILVQPLIERIPESADGGDMVDHVKRFASAPASAPQQYQSFLACVSSGDRTALYTPDMAASVSMEETGNVIFAPFLKQCDSSELGRILRTDMATYLPDDILTLTDRLSMWHSLELRVPFLDHDFVEWTARVPARLKINGVSQKYLLKRVAERWLPRNMIYHRKQGFEAPMGQWLRGPLLPFFDSIVNRRSVESSGLFNFGQIERLRNEHVAGRRKRSKILFALLMLFAWLQSPPR